MGYFPNGTSFEFYEARYCIRCVHHDGPDGEGMCTVMQAHMLHNYADCNKPDSILHILIPRSATGLYNEECTLFHESDAARRARNAVRDLFDDEPAKGDDHG